jgi:hypothetical protein
MNAYVEVIREDGTLERIRIEGDQVTVGRAMSAGLPLPDQRDLEPEHLLIAPRGDGCWVAINQEAKTQAKVKGQPFQHGMVPWGTEIEIGGLKLKVSDKDSTETGAKDKPKASPIVVLGGIALVGMVVFLYLRPPPTGLETTAPTEPVPLFATPQPCDAQGSAVLRQADLYSEIAMAKSERYPFDPSDGVHSARLYRRAQACYTQANVPASATEMQREAEFMERRVSEDYAAHQLRLGRALANERLEDALFEAEALLAILRREDEANPYIQWLGRTKRRVEVLLARPRRRPS